MQVDFQMIGKRIKEFRNDANYSQAELAEMADLSVSYISYIETAKKQVSLDALIRIANALDVTVDMILTENLFSNQAKYQTEIDILMDDCSSLEKRMFFELIRSTKDILRTNDWILQKNKTES